MKTYRLHIHPRLDFALAAALPDAAVRELIDLGSGHYMVDVQLQRRSHEEALQDIIAVLWNLGFA